MKPLLKLIVVFASILLISALLAPVLFDFLPYKFERIFNRIVMVLSLIAVLALVRLNTATLAQYGLLWKTDSLRQWIGGFFSGLITLLILAVLKIFLGVGTWNPESAALGSLLLKILGVMGAAVLIGLIEEFFFRGFIHGALKKLFGGRAIVAVLVTSLFYSLIHFISEKKPFIGPDPNFWDSLQLIATPIQSLADWPTYWRGAVGLFLFGIVLNIAWIKTGSLYLSMGIHAGCVFFVKLDGLLVDFSNDYPLLWGSANMYDGLTGWIFLILLGFFTWSYSSRQGKSYERS